jgi:choline dehydrogenase
MLSGIGPAESLGKLGIPVQVNLPGVGQNLHDHAGSPLVIAGNGQGFGYFRQDKGWRLLWNLLEYAMFRRGRLTTCGGEASSFHTTSEGPTPSVQIYCVPMIAYANTGADAIPAVDGIKLHVTLLRPHSRGTLSLRSSNPSDLPLVDPNYLGDSRDLRNLVEGMRTARELAATTPLREGLRGEMLPGEAVKDDAGLCNYIRSTVRTDWHPVGTCRMGRDDDPLGVVNDKLAVRGLDGLRVIDASVMPNIVSANTNAPTMALADRGVALMLSSRAR